MDNIYTIAVIDGNKVNTESLEYILNQNKLMSYILEDSNVYIIANINLALCEYLCDVRIISPVSFIFGIVNSGDIKYKHYKKENNEYTGESVNKDVGLPYNTIKLALKNISNKLEEKYGWNEHYREYLKHSALIEGSSLKHLWQYNCSHLLTEEQEKQRLVRVEEGQDYLDGWMKKYGDRLKLSKEVEKMMENSN